MRLTAWATLALLAGGGVCFAQDAQGSSAPLREGRVLRDEVCEMVDAYVQMKVQERLDLSDEQMVKVLPLIRRSHQERRDLEQRRHRALMEMRRLFLGGAATEERVQALLREAKAVEAEMPGTVRRNMDAIDAVLSPVQQAKYRLLEMEIDKRLRDLRHRARQRRGVADPGPGGPPLQP